MKNITQENSITIVGKELRASDARSARTVSPFREAFTKEKAFEDVKNRVSDDIYVVRTNFEHEGEDTDGFYSVIVGVEVAEPKNIPEGFVVKTIDPSKRSVFTVAGGKKDGVDELWENINAMDNLDRTYVCDYEIHHASGEIEIHVGIHDVNGTRRDLLQNDDRTRHTNTHGNTRTKKNIDRRREEEEEDRKNEVPTDWV